MAPRLLRIAPIALGCFFALGAFVAGGSPATAAGESTVYHHGSRTQRVVALTFDDGWTPSNCAKVDRTLREKGAAATFFPSARWVERAPAMWKAMATRYPFGNHTADHPHMTTLSYTQQVDQITRDRQVVERITGVPLIPVFRAPYGEFDATTLEAAAAAGYPVTMEWDVNVYDLTSKPDSELLAQATSGSNGSVITMHCGADATVRILPQVIDAYRARGFAFVTVPELLAGNLSAPASPAASAASTAAAAAGAGASGPTPQRPTSGANRDVLRAVHLLAVLLIAVAAVVLFGVLGGPGSGPIRGSGLRGQLRG